MEKDDLDVSYLNNYDGKILVKDLKILLCNSNKRGLYTGNPAWMCWSRFWYSKVFKFSKIHYGYVLIFKFMH